MGYKSAADGITKKGKTKGKNLGDSGPTATTQKGGTKTAGVSNKALKAMGRNMARAMNQRGSSRGR
jgi:hypothetical protein